MTPLTLILPWFGQIGLAAGGWQWLTVALIPILLWNRKVQHKGWVTWASMCFLGACAVSTVTALEPWASVFGMFQTHRQGLFQIGTLILIMHLYRKNDSASLKMAISFMGVVVGLSCIYQYILIQFGLGIDYFDGRAYGLLASPVYSGAFMAATVPTMVGRGLNESTKRQVAFAIVVLGMCATMSRGLAVAALVGTIAVYMDRKWAWGAFFVASIALMAFIWRPGAGNKEVGRQLTQRVAWAASKARPIQGIGLENFAFAWLSTRGKFRDEWEGAYRKNIQDHSHSMPLEVLSSVGIVGAMWFLVLLACILPGLKGWQLGVTLSVALYSLLNPIALPTLALVAMAWGSSKHGHGIQRAWALSLILISAPLWVWFHEYALVYGNSSQKLGAAIALGLLKSNKH